jgi:hypothetical protein
MLGREDAVMRALAVVLCIGLAPAAASGLQVWNRVVINEVFYYPMGEDALNEYIELLNAGGSAVFLDGAVITDEGTDGMPEGVFKFPGRYGEYNLRVEPGEHVLIAVDAVWGGIEPDLSNADWEFWHPADNNDNPSVPNIVLCSGGNVDIALANAGDGILIATGEDTTAAIDCWTVVDGVNWGAVPDLVPISWTDCVDPDPDAGCPQGNCICRCPWGLDHNASSEDDWFMGIPTPDEENIPQFPNTCAAVVRDGWSWGLIKAMYR